MASFQSEKVSEKIPDVGIYEEKKKMNQDSYIHSHPQQLKDQDIIPHAHQDKEEEIKNTTEDCYCDCNRDANGDVHKEAEEADPATIHESQSSSEKMKTKMGDNALIKKIEGIIHSHKTEHGKSVKPKEDAPKQSLTSKIKNLIEENIFLQQIDGHYKGGATEKQKEEAEKEKENETTNPTGHVKSLSTAEKIKIKVGDNALIQKLEEIIQSHKDSGDNGGSAEGAAGKQSLAVKVKNIIEDNAFIQKIYGHIKGGEKKQNIVEEGPKCTEKIDGYKEGEANQTKEGEQKKSITIGEKIKREVERNPLLQKIDGMIHGSKDAIKKPDGEKKCKVEEGVHKEEEKKSEHEHEYAAEYKKEAVPLS